MFAFHAGLADVDSGVRLHDKGETVVEPAREDNPWPGIAAGDISAFAPFPRGGVEALAEVKIQVDAVVLLSQNIGSDVFKLGVIPGIGTAVAAAAVVVASPLGLQIEPVIGVELVARTHQV